MSIFFNIKKREHPNFINRFLFNIIDEFSPKPEQPNKVDKIVLATRYQEDALIKESESSNYYVKVNHWQDGSINYWVMEKQIK